MCHVQELLVPGISQSKCNSAVSCRLVRSRSPPLYSPVLPAPPPTSTHTIHAALTRATQPSLGTIVLSALIVTGIRLLGLLTLGLRALPAYLPPYMRFVSIGAGMAVAYLEAATSSLSTYGLVYAGLTGDAFFPSARRSRALTGAVENPSVVNYRRRFQTERTHDNLARLQRQANPTLFPQPL